MHATSAPTQTPFHVEAEREIRRFTRKWTKRDDRLAALSYFATFAVFFASMALALASWTQWYVVVPAIVVNAVSVVRLYVLQHDTGHNSLFSTTRRNWWAGHGLSVFTVTPFAVMQHNHNAHHSHLGNLDTRWSTEIYTMTLDEWRRAGFWSRLHYRLYRNPFLMLPVGGFFTYAFAYRWPKNASKIAPWQVVFHNIALAAWIGMWWLIAGIPGLIIYAAILFAAGCLGVFLVYLQHNFEDTWWDRKPDLNRARAALQGSSALDLGWWFDLAVANITYHDIHHFNANIPSYRLRACHRALRQEYELPTIGWRQAVTSFRLKLWDEDQGRLVPFPPKGRAQYGPGRITL